MTNRTIRIVIILSGLILSGLILIQIYWVQKAYKLTDEQFNNKVNLALMSVASQVFKYNNDSTSVREPVTQVTANYFTVDINGTVSPDYLQNLLLIEFNRHSINQEFQFAIYDCFADTIINRSYTAELKEDISTSRLPIEPHKLPGISMESDSHRFGVYFPNKDKYILGQMGIMMYSSFGILVVMGFFVYIVFIILKQKRLSEIKSDFVNNMTHEFKTPIATILVSSEALSRPSVLADAERIQTYAHIIRDESLRLRGQVEHILRVAMLDSNSNKLRKEIINLNELVAEVIEKLRIRLEDKGCTLELQLDAKLAEVSGDRDHLMNVMFNLVDNALKYAENKPHIVIKSYNKNKKIYVSVQDNGIGIPKESQKLIFERFYRVPTGNVHNVKGFGLGLNYVKQIIDLHGGQISLQSKPGQGSTFLVSLTNL